LKRKKRKNVYFVSLKSETKKSEAKLSETKNVWKQNKAKIWCINFALVGSEKFEVKRRRKKKLRERAKHLRNGSRFTSFRFFVKMAHPK
jgi:hypothetical protein